MAEKQQILHRVILDDVGKLSLEIKSAGIERQVLSTDLELNVDSDYYRFALGNLIEFAANLPASCILQFELNIRLDILEIDVLRLTFTTVRYALPKRVNFGQYFIGQL